MKTKRKTNEKRVQTECLMKDCPLIPPDIDKQVREMENAVERLASDKSDTIAFFTGAGASKIFGYPLTGDLLPTIIEWADDKDFLDLPGQSAEWSANRRKTLKWVLKHLLPGNFTKSESLPLVTTLLSVIDHAIVHRQPLWPKRTVKGLRFAREVIDHAIFDVLGEYNPFSGSEEKEVKRFGKMLGKVRSLRKGRRVGIITTNYDMSSDWAVLTSLFNWEQDEWTSEQASEIDFGTEWLDPHAAEWSRIFRPKDAKAFCYKLHGSTNWLRCPICQQIYINFEGSTWFQGFRQRRDYNNTCFCSDTKLEAQIVSPSFVRQMDDLNLLNIWSHAHTVLYKASHWVFIGYGLPEEDIAIRALLIRALHARKQKSPLRITVIQYSERERLKYEALLGGHELLFLSGGIERFLDVWNKFP